jgi:glycosyltransferase involved in cell wall biosynthesis
MGWSSLPASCWVPEVSYSLVSVVLPVHNQADHLQGVLQEYESALGTLPVAHECLLVVNGCTDRSLEVCRERSACSPAERVIHSEQSGWGHAVLLGLEAARGDLLCYTNLARTTSTDLKSMLLCAVAEPGVVVKANRKIRDSWQRRVGSLLYNLECRALFDLAYWDVNGTPKVFPRSCDKLLRLTRRDNLIDAEFAMVCRREGYPVLEVPIFSSRRHGGTSTTGYLSALSMYWGTYRLWRTLRNRRP